MCSENGRWGYRQAVTEGELAAKLAKVIERLTANAASMDSAERGGMIMMGWFMCVEPECDATADGQEPEGASLTPVAVRLPVVRGVVALAADTDDQAFVSQGCERVGGCAVGYAVFLRKAQDRWDAAG